MRRRFTIFELAIVLLVLGVLAMVAVPDVTIRDREVGEAAAVRSLVRLAVEEYAATAGGTPTPPSSLAALARRAGLETSEPAADGSLRIGAYRFALYRPGPDGRPVAAVADGPPAPPAFLLLAWPVRPGETGVRLYGVDESLVVQEDPVELETGATPRPPFPRLQPGTDRPWPAPWRPLLPHELPREIRVALTERGLPVPSPIDEMAGK